MRLIFSLRRICGREFQEFFSCPLSVPCTNINSKFPYGQTCNTRCSICTVLFSAPIFHDCHFSHRTFPSLRLAASNDAGWRLFGVCLWVHGAKYFTDLDRRFCRQPRAETSGSGGQLLRHIDAGDPRLNQEDSRLFDPPLLKTKEAGGVLWLIEECRR
jgi:hypothetical protein